MPFKIIKHTADLCLKVEGTSLKNLFEEAFAAVMKILKVHELPASKTTERKITAEGPDSTALLVNFLNEIVTLCHIKKEIYGEIQFDIFSEHQVGARCRGTPVEFFGEDVKAVTFHEADIKVNVKGNYETLLVFDT